MKNRYIARMSILENKNIMGVLLAIGGFSSFAFGDVIIKYMGAYYTPYTIAFYLTFSCSFILTLCGTKLGGLRRSFRSKKLKLHLLRGLFVTAQLTLMIYGFSQLPMTTAYALVFLTPFLASLLAIPLLGERVRRKQWLAIALGFAGVLIVLRPGVMPLNIAVVAVLGSAFCFAMTNVLVRVIGAKEETLLSFALLPELVICSISFLLYLTQPQMPSVPHLALFFLCGAFSAVALLLVPMAFLRAPAATVSPFHYIQIVWGALFGYLFFGDIVDLWVAIGGLVIVSSGIWLIRQEKGKVPDYGTL